MILNNDIIISFCDFKYIYIYIYIYMLYQHYIEIKKIKKTITVPKKFK
ncbi:MAG: hypothetical protein N7Q72_05985 [Spiroplasma sp. Tabriz.8]|nr:hypothetical protein [Spiroplasma sp. Tabriz.8]